MKLSYNWLNDFVDLDDINARELAEILTLKTAETEGVYSVEEHFTGIMSASIEKCEKIDEKYFKCTVKADKDYTVISGAPNTREGLITFFVKPGGMIDGSEIGRKEVADTVSQGMLLSGRELGINNDHSGLIEMQDIEPGIDIDNIIDFNDHIIEIDNKSLTHRPDLWGIYGFAREVAAILGRDLKDYHVFDMSDIDADNDFPIEIRDRELCYRYAGIKIGNIRADNSPLNIQARLMRTGHVPRNTIVDLTNYVMTELGQPMHSFDGSKIEGIIIDSTEGSTKYTTLDNEERELPSGTLMINSQDGPVAIAGIMGGGNSEINKDSTSLFLESAAFNAGAIRKTSSALGLRTDSSSRFEKSLDPEYALTAALRYILLLSEIQPDIEFLSALTDINLNPFTRNIIKTDTDFIRNTIGADISNETIVDILSALGFDTDIDSNKLTVTAPTFRSTKDVSIREDIVEEIARIYGYNEIEASLPAMTLSVPDFNNERDTAVRIKDILAQQFDMNETDSYIWHDNDFLKQIQYNTTCSIELRNPVSSVNTLLRDSMLTTMLRFSLENLKFYDSFRLFDIGRIFPHNEEKEALGLVIINEKAKNGDENTFLEMKKIVNTLFHGVYSQLPDYSPSGDTSLLKPGMTADIRFRDRTCGITGALNPLHNKLFDKKVNAALCQIDMEAFLLERETAGFEQFSPYPISRADFSIMKPDSMSFSSLRRIVEGFRDELIKESEITAIYSGKGIDEGYKSVTYRFTLSSREKTPDNEMLQSLRERFISYLKEHGLQLR